MAELRIAGWIWTAVLLFGAALIRVLAIPKFTMMPGGFQLLLEELVAMTDGLFHGIFALCRGLVRGVAGFFRALHAAGVKGRRGIAALWRTRRRALLVWFGCIALFLVLSMLAGSHGEHEDVKVAMRDAVLHDVNRISLFGLKDVNPALIAAMTVSGILLVFALIVRVFVIPRFKAVPGPFQLALETLVKTLDGLAKVEDPTKKTFVGAYVFAVGVYIFVGTIFELFGVQAVTTEGVSVSLPAPLSDVNAAICMGCLSYLVIMGGGAFHNGGKGVIATLKEFSLPISMSFRLFGALLSGLLVTDLIYHYAVLSYVLPVVVAVIFTLLHAIVQSYVLTMLVGIYWEEVTEKEEEKHAAA